MKHLLTAVALCATVCSAHAGLRLPIAEAIAALLVTAQVGAEEAKPEPVENEIRAPYGGRSSNPRAAYLIDCQRYGNTLDRCVRIWDGPPRETPVVIKTAAPVILMPPENEVKMGLGVKPRVIPPLLDVDNEEYKRRRAETLKNPNWVIEQLTIR